MANLLDSASILLTPTAYNNGSILAIQPSDGSGDMSFSRGSSATRVNEQGLIEDIASNLPRIDYTDGCGSLLLEPQSTNLITQSELFSDASWAKQVGGVASAPLVTSNYAISPDGTQNASRVVFDLNGGTTSSAFSQLQTIITGTTGVDYTSSVYMKSNDSNTYDVTFIDVAGSTTIVSVTPQWKRFDLTAVLVSTNMRIRTRGSEGSSDVTDVLIWGAQVEQNSYASSYIPTSGAISTRLSDIANGAGNASLINSEEGVLYAEISALANDLTNRFISISNGSKAERVEIGYSNVSNKVFAYSNVGNVNQCNISFVLPNVLDYNKIALKYKLNDFSLWVNGVKVGVDLNASVSAENILNELAFDEGDGTDVFYSKTKAVAIYKTALTDEQLTALTTI